MRWHATGGLSGESSRVAVDGWAVKYVHCTMQSLSSSGNAQRPALPFAVHMNMKEGLFITLSAVVGKREEIADAANLNSGAL